MRSRLAPLVILLCAVTPAFASYGGKPDLPPPSSSASVPADNPGSSAMTPRQQAEGYYRDAYDDVQKGSKELEDGKGKSAEKRFKRALDHSRRAVELDSTYYQAWNLVGFTSRKLGDYPHSFDAYLRALRIKPDFALAREYYGEGLLETGDLGGALQQLSWLRKIGDDTQTAMLQASVDKYRAAHPDTTSSATK